MMEFDGEEDALEATFTPVAALTNFGVQANDIKKLKEAGFMTIQAVMMCSRRKLALIKGFSDAKVEKVYDAASKVDSDLLAFHTAADLQARRDSIIVRVTTGCDELNDILGGGIESSSITELYGEFRTGKSQLSLTVAVASFLPREVGGGEGRAMYLDTEGSFRPERLKPIAARFDLDADFVVSNVLYARVYNCDHLDTMLVEAGSIFAEAEATGGPFRTLIVDSIIGVYRQEFIGRGELAERQQRMGCVLQKLKCLAEQFNLAVLLTNQVTADPGAGAALVADAKKPVGGHILAHASDTRLYLRKGKGEQRVAKVVDSPLVGERDAVFSITNGGITAAQD